MQIPSHSSTRPAKRWLPTLLGSIALVSVLLAGCANANGLAGQRDPNQVFVFPDTVDQHPLPYWQTTDKLNPTESGLNLDPAYLGDLYSQIVDSMIQIQLVSFDQNLNIIPDAAESWTTSSDGKTWTFKLRSGLKWADGWPMTAADFVLGMNHYIDPNLCSAAGPFTPPLAANRPWANCNLVQIAYLSAVQGANEYFNQIPDKTTGKPPTSISGISAVDSRTLQVTLNSPISYFLGEMATPVSMPIESRVWAQYHYNYVEHFADPQPLSQSGPFYISGWNDPTNPSVTTPQHSTQITFLPNPNWWGKPLILKKVVMPLIPSQNDFYARYQLEGANKIDYAVVPAHEYPFTQNLPDFHAVRQLSIEYFGMNFIDPPFDNLQVRQALSLSLNKQTLVDSVFQGANSPTNHIIPEGIPGADPSLLTPPDNVHGTVSLTGNQTLAQSLITQVANQCKQDATPDWCPYVIGTGSANTPVSSVSGGGASCPNYNVNANGGVSTQKPIVVYAAINNPDRVAMANGAAQEWSNALCLKVTTNDLLHISTPFNTLLGQIYGNANKGGQTTVGIWTIGYGVDYNDPQDFTSNQFLAPTSNNAANFGIYNPNATDNAQQAAIVKLMAAADVMPSATAVQRAARLQAYQNIEQALVDEVAWIPYDQPQTLYRVRSYVMNFQLPVDGFLSDQSWASIYIAAHNG